MAEPPVAIHVDHHVALEGATKVHRQPDNLRYGFGILAVDVEYRDLEHFRHIGCVGTGLVFGRRRRKADLVVYDHVERSPNCIAVELA